MNRFKCPACGGEQYTSADRARDCIYCTHTGELHRIDMTLSRRIVRKIEWIKCPGHEDILFCPCCGGLKIYGHKPDCELVVLLRESEDEP